VEAFLILGALLVLAVAQFSAYGSILRVGGAEWERVGRSKAGLMALVFFSGGLGGIYYWAVIRRELRTA
jgi:hypothetical protein